MVIAVNAVKMNRLIMASVTLPGNDRTLYQYDGLNRLTVEKIERFNGNATQPIAEYDYTLRDDGLRSGVTELTYDDTSTTPFSTVNIGWTYDNLGRLQVETRSGSTNSSDDYTANYAFDLAGNRTQYVRTKAARIYNLSNYPFGMIE